MFRFLYVVFVCSQVSIHGLAYKGPRSTLKSWAGATGAAHFYFMFGGLFAAQGSHASPRWVQPEHFNALSLLWWGPNDTGGCNGRARPKWVQQERYRGMGTWNPTQHIRRPKPHTVSPTPKPPIFVDMRGFSNRGPNRR